MNVFGLTLLFLGSGCEGGEGGGGPGFGD